MRAGSPMSAKAACGSEAASPAPVWKPSQTRGASARPSASSSQNGVSASISAQATAPAAGPSGAGGRTMARTEWTVAGCAMASMMARNAACASSTGSEKPPSRALACDSINLRP